MDGFLQGGFAGIRDALAETSTRAGLHLRPATIARTLAARVRTQLRALETIFRRLLLLLAASLDLHTAPTQAPRPHTSRTDGSRTGPPHCGFCLLPVWRYDAAALEALRGKHDRVYANCTATVRLLHRLGVLLLHLENPLPLARRLARRINGLKARGEVRPFCVPQENRFRLPASLALTAGILPERVNEALKAWFDSG